MLWDQFGCEYTNILPTAQTLAPESGAEMGDGALGSTANLDPKDLGKGPFSGLEMLRLGVSRPAPAKF